MKLYPNLRYEMWLRGEDYGRHPEEPTGKSTAAPQPTAEEFIFNPKNKDKPIPLCLLEPNTSKKRRHPIHKKKSIGTDGFQVARVVFRYLGHAIEFTNILVLVFLIHFYPFCCHRESGQKINPCQFVFTLIVSWIMFFYRPRNWKWRDWRDSGFGRLPTKAWRIWRQRRKQSQQPETTEIFGSRFELALPERRPRQSGRLRQALSCRNS